MPLRLHYSMIVVRLVNGVTDSAQKGSTAVSVASLATTAGVVWRYYKRMVFAKPDIFLHLLISGSAAR